MADRELLALWARVETALGSVLQSVVLDPEVRAQIEEWLSHNELGLAFTDLVEALNEGNAFPDPKVVAALCTAASEMQLEDNPDLLKVMQRVRPE